MTTNGKMKAEIISIGLSWPHEPDEYGHVWTIRNWGIKGGDFAGTDYTNRLVGGWSPAELALVSDLGKAIGTTEAMKHANSYRFVADPQDPPSYSDLSW